MERLNRARIKTDLEFAGLFISRAVGYTFF
jgi:hypothetical protein